MEKKLTTGKETEEMSAEVWKSSVCALCDVRHILRYTPQHLFKRTILAHGTGVLLDEVVDKMFSRPYNSDVLTFFY